MNLIIRTVYLCAILAACGACAHNSGGAKDARVAAADATSAGCEANDAGREYRNQYLHARRIGRQACSD